MRGARRRATLMSCMVTADCRTVLRREFSHPRKIEAISEAVAIKSKREALLAGDHRPFLQSTTALPYLSLQKAAIAICQGKAVHGLRHTERGFWTPPQVGMSHWTVSEFGIIPHRRLDRRIEKRHGNNTLYQSLITL
jgi:hypothetical protein